jgi:predicted AAA+ superfamily ATPase
MERFINQELLQACHTRPQLYFWNREKKGSHAEVDFLVQKQQDIIPIEVKSGNQGKMQSLRILLQEKKISIGTRVSMENFGQYENIRVLPLYAVSSIFDEKPIAY